MPPADSSPRRADAQRNRERILEVAREAFAESSDDVSMAEISRRAGVGMATLYRNFPSRRALLETLYGDEVDALCAAALTVEGETPADRFDAWLHRFFDYFRSKRAIASALLEIVPDDDPVFGANRFRVFGAAEPLLAAARASGELRDDLALGQILDLTIAVAKVPGDSAYVRPILRATLDGLRSEASR